MLQDASLQVLYTWHLRAIYSRSDATCCCNVVVFDHDHVIQPDPMVDTTSYQDSPFVEDPVTGSGLSGLEDASFRALHLATNCCMEYADLNITQHVEASSRRTSTAATIAAVAVAIPLMRCIRFSAMRSAVRIAMALPRTLPNSVPLLT